MTGLFITGTDTGVGKTWVGCQIARQLHQRGVHVTPRKPVESGCQKQGETLIPEDATRLMQAADYQGSLEDVCPWRFEAAISPERAARLLNQPLHTAQLAQACRQQQDTQNDFLLVEGAGGFYSPLCADGLNADLAEQLALPVLLVAEDRLGCINQILLSVEAIASRRLPLKGVVLNHRGNPQSTVHMDNIADLARHMEYPLYRIEENTAELPEALIHDILS